MDLIKTQRVLGLMSSSSLDGVNAAVISCDGVDVFDFGVALNIPYDDDLCESLRFLQGQRREDIAPEKLQQIEQKFTAFNADIVQNIMADYGEKPDLIGFHGYTLLHEPQQHYTCQLGNAQALANQTGIKVVSCFRNADIRSGGQGAPLSAVFHASLGSRLTKPAAFLDIGGITSLTWLGVNGEIMAFDVGPGLAPLNDWVQKHGGQHTDYNGKLAVTGQVHADILSSLMRHKYLALPPPKALDRDLFKDKFEHLEGLSLSDGAATATAFIAETVAYSLALYVPEMPEVLIVYGAGAQNPTLVRFLRQKLENVEVKLAEDEGWKSSAFEAQAFAFLAARRLHGLPASYPATTGVPEPIVCGEIFNPEK